MCLEQLSYKFARFSRLLLRTKTAGALQFVNASSFYSTEKGMSPAKFNVSFLPSHQASKIAREPTQQNAIQVYMLGIAPLLAKSNHTLDI